MHSPLSMQQENLTATASNVPPDFLTPVLQPTYGYVGPFLCSWSGPQVPEPAPPIAHNASLIREVADAITPQEKLLPARVELARYNGGLLQWHGWYNQF